MRSSRVPVRVSKVTKRHKTEHVRVTRVNVPITRWLELPDGTVMLWLKGRETPIVCRPVKARLRRLPN